MKRKPTNEYLRTKVLTATPAELRMMLLDGAVRFVEQAIEGLQTKDYERSFEGITRTQAILAELLNGLDPTHDEELCKRLSGLYTYMYTRLIAASSTRDVAIVEEVAKLLRYERETWQLLMQKLAPEASGAGANEAAVSSAATPKPAGAQPTRGRISIQG